jgi:hypothetical protein
LSCGALGSFEILRGDVKRGNEDSGRWHWRIGVRRGDVTAPDQSAASPWTLIPVCAQPRISHRQSTCHSAASPNQLFCKPRRQRGDDLGFEADPKPAAPGPASSQQRAGSWRLPFAEQRLECWSDVELAVGCRVDVRQAG